MTDEQRKALLIAFEEWNEHAKKELANMAVDMGDALGTQWPHGVVHVAIVAIPTLRDHNSVGGVVLSDSFSGNPANLMFIADFISNLAVERFQAERDAKNAITH